MKSMLAVFMAAVMCLTSIGCGTPASNLIVALNAVSDAASVAVVVTQALVVTGKVDQETADLVSTYSASVGTAVNTTMVELNSTDTNAQKIEKITAAFAQVAVPAMGKNSTAILAAINAVTAAINIFISHLNGAPVVAAAKLSPHAAIVLNSSDKTLLKKIKTKNAETLAAAASLKVKK